MIPMLGLLIWAYVIARLLQTPATYIGSSRGIRIWLGITSLAGITLASFAMFSLLTSGMDVGHGSTGTTPSQIQHAPAKELQFSDLRLLTNTSGERSVQGSL
jgi:hypothetical protein